MDHLQEIEDAAARNGVNTFKTQMEIIVLSLLDHDPGIALTQIEEARTVSLDQVRSLGSAIGYEGKAGRIAIRMLESTFERLRIVIESPDDNDFFARH